jgi:hypothetical protein
MGWIGSLVWWLFRLMFTVHRIARQLSRFGLDRQDIIFGLTFTFYTIIATATATSKLITISKEISLIAI